MISESGPSNVSGQKNNNKISCRRIVRITIISDLRHDKTSVKPNSYSKYLMQRVAYDAEPS